METVSDSIFEGRYELHYTHSTENQSNFQRRLFENDGGPGSSAGIATGYGLDSPGIESRWGEIFRTCPDRPWGPPSLLYNGYRIFPGGKERPGFDADPSPPSSAMVMKRVELYLYSPYRPYGLYRASVPVQGRPLPLPFENDEY